MVVGYSKKSFVEFDDWLYIQYGQIMPRDLIKNQDTMQALCHVEDTKLIWTLCNSYEYDSYELKDIDKRDLKPWTWKYKMER